MVDVGCVVNTLRSAPLERPANPIFLPQRGRTPLRRIRVLAPIAAAFALASTGAIGSLNLFHGTEPEFLGVVGGAPAAVGDNSRLVPGFRVTGRLVAE
jgi:hypothetical protein